MNSNNRNIPSDNDDGSFLVESYSQGEGGHYMDSGSWRHPHEESYDDEYVEGTHYSLSTVTEEDSQQVEVTGTESQRGMSPSDFSFSTFNFPNERAGTSPAPSQVHRAPGGHDDSPLRSPVLSFGTEKHPTHRISPQDSPSSLTPSPLPDTIEAHDILFAQETAGMLHYRTELEGFWKQAARSAVNESLTDDTEWRINFANMAVQAEQQHAPEVELCISPSLPSSSAVSISTGQTSISASKLASTSAEIALERVSSSKPTQPTSANAQAMLTQKVQHLRWKMEGEEDGDCGNGIDSAEGEVTTGRQEDTDKDLAESILVLESDRQHQYSRKTNATFTDIASSVRATEPTEIASIVGVLQKEHANELKGQVEAIVLHMDASDHPPSLPAAASHRTTSCTVCMSREQEAQTTEATMMARENEKHPVELFEIIHKQVHAMVHMVANEVMRLEGKMVALPSALQSSLETEKSGTEGGNDVLGMDMVERVQEQQQLLTRIEMASQEDEGFLAGTEIVGDQLRRRLAVKQRMLEGELEHESHGQHGDIVSGLVSGMPTRLNLEVDIDMDDDNDLMTPQSMASSTRSEMHHQMTFRTKLASQIIKKNAGEAQKDHIMLEQRVAEQRVGEILEQHVPLLVSTCAAISRNIEGSLAVTQHLKNAESLVQCVEIVVDRVQDELTSKVKELKSQIKAKTKALQEVTEELSIARAMSQDAGKTSFTVADGPVPNPVSEDPSMVKDVKKIEDATASEVQRLKNKLQHVNNTIVQHEKKMNGLERSLATSQNLARQREEESNRLKDRMYENEADARRKIERLTTYTQNLIKDIEKKELQVDQKKADIMLLHQKLEEKEKEIGNAQEESKQVRIESRHQLLAIENKLRKSIEAHQVIKEELSVTRTENSKKIMTLDTTIATQLEQMEASNKLIKLQQIEIQALKAREEELSGGTANARSQLSYFVNKAIDAGKQSTDYKQQFHVTETALNQARELIKSLRKAKSNLEASLRATLNQQAELQKHLDQALHTIDGLKLDIAQLDSERLGTNRLLDLAYKNQSVIESEIAQNTANHAKHIDERDTKIALLQSKQTVAEMREGKLSRQVQELSQTRDTLSRDLQRCSSDLKGSKECLEALRSEKDALECILQANKVIEKGHQHRAINFEKALSSGALALGGTVQQKEVGLAERWAGDGGAAKSGIPYRFESENQSNQGENKMRGGIVKRGVQGSSKKAEGVAVECGTGREIDDDSFFKGIGPALSPVLDNTVLCGSEDVERRNVSPPIEGSKVVGGRTHTYAQGANTHVTALVPKPPSHQKHAQDYSKRNPEFAGKGGQKSSERETARPRQTEREDWGPRTHRLHPISVSEVDGGGRREDARGGGPLTGIGNMLSDDLLYYQRLVRGSGAS